MSNIKERDYDKLREQVIIKLTMLIGACRMPRISKKQIEKSLNEYRDKLVKDLP